MFSTSILKMRTFTLALIQLGNISYNKTDNLRHAHKQILKAAQGSEMGKQPDVIVLPVSRMCVGSVFSRR